MTVNSRFKDACWLQKASENTVLILGAGGTGSWTALLLNRVGTNVIVQDFDRLEEHNLGGQFFNYKQIGKLKVEALAENITLFNNNKQCEFLSEKFTTDSMIHDVVISCFDNMEARRIAFEKWVQTEKTENAIFIDLRLIMESATIFAVINDNFQIEEYRRNLFSDSEVPDAPCTMKQTSHAACFIASTAVSILMNHFTNVSAKSKVRNVPFKWECHLALMLIEEDNYGIGK